MKSFGWALFAVALAASAVEAAPWSKDFPAGRLNAVVIETGGGDVSVSAADAKSVGVQALRFDESRCRLSAEVRGATLHLKLENASRWAWGGDACRASLSVTAPSGMALSVFSGSGDLRLDGMAGGIDARTGSGAIDGSVASASVVARSGSGDVTLSWTKPAARGSADVKSGSGDVRLSFPKGMKVASRALTGSGTVRDEAGGDSQAGFAVSAMTGSGDIDFARAR